MKSGQSCAAEIPIRHSDFGDAGSSDVGAAAKWAWRCVLSLERAFCDTYGIGEYELVAQWGEPPDARTWLEAQAELHKAIDCLDPAKFALDGCAACSMASAMAQLTAGPYMPEERVIPLRNPSWHHNRSRECVSTQSIIMSLDLKNLPVMPPWRLESIVKVVGPAQAAGLRILELIAQNEVSDSPTPPEPEDAESALERLLDTLRRHRLIFLLFVDAYDIDRDEITIRKANIAGWRNLEQAIEPSGNFLVRHENVINAFAREAINMYGLVPERRARIRSMWKLSEEGWDTLDKSSHTLLENCGRVNSLDRDGTYREVLSQVMGIIYDKEDRPFWNPPTLISWVYFERLERTIHAVRKASMGLHVLDKPSPEKNAPKPLVEPTQATPHEVEPPTPSGAAVTGHKDVVVVDYVRKDDGWHWFIDGQDKGTAGKRELTKIRKVSSILFDQAGMGWIPHETFMNATGWKPGAYFDQTGHTGTMQKILTKLRGLGLKIEFEKDKGVRLGDGKVNYRKHSRISF